MNNFELLFTKALNSARRSSPITYVALRALMDSCPKDNQIKLLSSIMSRQLQTSNKWHYRNFKVFKEKEPQGIEYRELTIGSPLTLLAEAMLIDKLQENKIYNDNPNVYSYRLPFYKNSGQNFAFFMHGYKKRNEKIELALAEGNFAYIFDLKKFYPSVNQKQLYEVFNNKIEISQCEKKTKKQLNIFINSLLEATNQGVAANPDFGHLCADLYLENFDFNMTQHFGTSHYFRYVDDLVIISSQETQLDEIRAKIKQLLPIGLELNEKKTDLVNYEQWSKISFDDIDKINDEFSDFMTSLTIYLALNPKKLGNLKQEFNDKNIFLPFDKIFANSQYKRQVKFYKSLLFDNYAYLLYLFGKSHNFLEIAETLKNKLFYILEKLPDIKILNGFERRLLIQKYRFCINRLLIFSGKESIEKILFLIPDEKEFIEIRILIIALLNNDVSELVKFNGNTILSFCELWKSNLKEKPIIQISEEATLENYFDAILTLVLHDILPVEIIPIDKFDHEKQALLHSLKIAQKQGRIFNNLNYYDEITTILNRISHDEIGTYLTTRYNDNEVVDLETLKIGSGISSGF
ncbi:RNA-directed DNA polymerase [Sulfurospirillum oryzae]|uniref:RNA-directed DNA polymerase n=1 Tax=Sulfurospirillum oryzae TaxID=2976535 RepID=UPI0021E7D853|nr:RNA-directed DNA polymerase [Sulfurospirillum oryzae]